MVRDHGVVIFIDSNIVAVRWYARRKRHPPTPSAAPAPPNSSAPAPTYTTSRTSSAMNPSIPSNTRPDFMDSPNGRTQHLTAPLTRLLLLGYAYSTFLNGDFLDLPWKSLQADRLIAYISTSYPFAFHNRCLWVCGCVSMWATNNSRTQTLTYSRTC